MNFWVGLIQGKDLFEGTYYQLWHSPQTLSQGKPGSKAPRDFKL